MTYLGPTDRKTRGRASLSQTRRTEGRRALPGGGVPAVLDCFCAGKRGRSPKRDKQMQQTPTAKQPRRSPTLCIGPAARPSEPGGVGGAAPHRTTRSRKAAFAQPSEDVVRSETSECSDDREAGGGMATPVRLLLRRQARTEGRSATSRSSKRRLQSSRRLE